jgi:hypothetical protein
MVSTVTRLIASAELLCAAEDLVAGLVKSKRITPESAKLILGDIPSLREEVRRQTELIGEAAERLIDRVEVVVQFLLLHRADFSEEEIARLDQLRNAVRG